MSRGDDDASAEPSGAEAFLAARPIFASAPPAVVHDLAGLMTPFLVEAGDTLFREGDPCRYLYVIERGELEVLRRLPGERELRMGVLGPGEMIGEMALIRGIEHAATARALTAVSGYRAGTEMLSALTAGGSALRGQLADLIAGRALDMLRREYELVAESLAAASHPSGPDQAAPGVADGPHPSSPLPSAASVAGEPDWAAAPESGEEAHLADLLFFREFTSEQVASFVADPTLSWVTAPRGAVLVERGTRPDAYLLVVHGAVEAVVQDGGATARVLLRGPGRGAAYLGVLTDEPSPVTVRARERCVAIVVPRERLEELLQGGDALARRFVRALYVDLVGAVEQAQRPLAQMAAARVSPRPR